MKNQKGFSLIELMIVVVIIGILSTIAVPQYQNFQKKAKQSEAKTNLSSLFTTMKSFQAEWNQYYGDFRALGFDQSGRLNYNLGFNGGAPPAPPTHPSYTGAAVQYQSRLRCGTSAITNQECVLGQGAIDGGTALAGAVITNGANPTFTVGARGNIDSDLILDYWTINQLKVLSQPNAAENDVDRN